MKNNTKNRKALMLKGIDAMAIHGANGFDLSQLEAVAPSQFTRKGARSVTLSNSVKLLLDSNGIYERKLESKDMQEMLGSSVIYGNISHALNAGLSIIDNSAESHEKVQVRESASGKTISGKVLFESEAFITLTIGKAMKSFELKANKHNSHKMASIIKRQSL